MKDRNRTIMALLLALLLIMAACAVYCHVRSQRHRLTEIIFRDDARWVYESAEGFLDPLTLLASPGEEVSVSPSLIDLRILGETAVCFTLSSADQQKTMTVRVIEPLITLRYPLIYVATGQCYDPDENVICRCGYQLSPQQIDTSVPGSHTVTVTADGEGVISERSFEVIVTDRQMVWVVDEPYQPAHTVDVWVVDTPAVSEQGHWEVTEPAVSEQGHYEEVTVPERGHWQDVIVSPEVPEQGHWETVHHEAVIHQQPVYEEYKLWIFEFSDGAVFRVYQYELQKMGLTATQYAARYEDAHPGVTGRWHSEIEKRLVGYQTVVDKPAWDEQVWIIDVPYQQAVVEKQWIVDEPEHKEKRWVVDVPAQPEKKKWVVDVPARQEQGHWEQRTVAEVPEKGHWQLLED